MPLSPADFYAYSRATGAPVADTPEDRAKQAPEVLAFQENRLQAPKQGPGLLDILGAGALGVGGAIAASYAGPRLARAFRNRGAAQAATQTVVEDVTPQAAQNVRRAAAAYTQPRPSTEPVPSRVPTAGPTVRETPLLPGTAQPKTGVQMVNIQDLLMRNAPSAVDTGTPYSAREIAQLGLANMEVAPNLDVADRLLEEYELGKQSRQASRIKAAQQDREMQLRGIGARIIDQLKGESLVEQQQAQLAQHVDQSLNAVNAAEDQMTGRVKHALQQNPDLDMSQVEVLEDMAEQSYRQGMEQDEPINMAAAQVLGRVPNDQAETPQVSAQNFLQQRRTALAAQGLTPGRIERELMQGPEGTRIKQGAELYAATGTPSTLELLSETPSLPITVQPKTLVSAGRESLETDVPTGALYKAFAPRDPNVGSLIHADIYHTNAISNAADKLAGTPTHIENPEYTALVEQTNMAQHAMSQGDNVATAIFNRNRAAFRNNQVPERLIPNPEHIDLQRDIEYHTQARESVRNRQTAKELDVERFPNLMAVQQMQEGTRAFAEIDPATGDIKPGTLELRPGRPSVPAGTVDKTAMGTAIRGRTGAIETENELDPESLRYSNDIVGGTYRPTDSFEGQTYTANPIVWDPNLHTLQQRSPEGYVYSEEAMKRPTAVSNKSYSTRPSSSPETARRSVDMSEQLIRAQREGGTAKAQALLDSFKKGLI
jgi:hypothetical protein